MISYGKKLEDELLPLIRDIQKPIILELGVQRGNSTKKLLKLCESNNGHLYSLDVNDCSNIIDNKKWTFIKSRDDDFDLLIKIPNDLIFIDTLHEKHVENLIYNYLKIDYWWLYFIDDISTFIFKNKVIVIFIVKLIIKKLLIKF